MTPLEAQAVRPSSATADRWSAVAGRPARALRIAQVAPLFESVPPRFYGGTERVVSYLTEELVRLGHRVTLFASGDSKTRARLFPIRETSYRLDPNGIDHLAHYVLMLEQVFQRMDEFDIVHFHIDYLHFPLSRRNTKTAHLTTLHGRLDIPELVPLYQEFTDIPVVSISQAQRAPLPMACWAGTVYHGLPTDLLTPQGERGDYLAFLGRTSPEKGLDNAIAIARRAGKKLKIAAKVDEADKAYFHEHIKPLLNEPFIEFIGEIKEHQKQEFLANALALLFPIDWPEPFGLVMIEAMATGTPVIAFPRGSVPEVIEDGVTGFVVNGVDEAVEAVAKAASLDRTVCRSVFEERFSAPRMAGDYLKIYHALIAAKTNG